MKKILIRWIKSFSRLWIAIFTLACLPLSAEVYFSEDMESYDLGSLSGDVPTHNGGTFWINSDDPATASVEVVDIGGDQDRVLYIEDAKTVRLWMKMAMSMPRNQELLFQYDIADVSSGGWGHTCLYLYDGNGTVSTDNRAIDTRWQGSGNPHKFRNMATPDETMMEYDWTSTPRWFHVEMTVPEYDATDPASTYHMYVVDKTDGTVVVDGRYPLANITSDYSCLLWYQCATDYGKFYLDNVQISQSRTALPTISPEGGCYLEAQSVTISCETPDATIRYTTDGSEPTGSSTEFTGVPLLISAGTTLRARAWAPGYIESRIRTEAFQKPILPGWYASVDQNYTPAQMVADGAKSVVLYTSYYDDMTDPDQYNALRDYLNSANDVGLKVILGVDGLVREGDMTGLTLMVDHFKNYLAVVGWFLYDEPNDEVTSLSYCEQADDIIKARSAKPIYIVFCRTNLDNDLLSPVTFKDTYDVMMFDQYPWHLGDPEFYGLDDIGGWPGWISRYDQAKSQAEAAGKPLHIVLQALGYQSETLDFRLPTYDEERFMMAYSLLNGVEGVNFWCAYRLISTPSSPDQVYPYDGYQWIEDVAEPVMAEITTLGMAVCAGEVPGGVSVDRSDIQAKVYHDSVTEKSYLISVNKTSGSETATFTLDLPQEFEGAVPEYEASEQIAIVDGVFADAFTDYDVHIYWLVPVASYTLTVTPASRSVGWLAGSTTFAVTKTGTGTMAWTAEVISGGDWLTIASGVSGTDNGSITVDCSENESETEDRMGTIRITAAGATGSPKEVTVVQARHPIPGDANEDGVVDVGDLGIVAANYGGSNKTWLQGDFNGDGRVDVGDLGILAAHYGEGVSGTANFDADYVTIFGEMEARDATDEADSWSCSELGLPLIVGVVLIGIMFVKL